MAQPPGSSSAFKKEQKIASKIKNREAESKRQSDRQTLRLLCHFYPPKLIRQIIILIPCRSLFWLHTTLETLFEILPILLIRISILLVKVKTRKEKRRQESRHNT